MKTDTIAAVSLVILGCVLTAVSIPYISENTALGVVGVVSGILVILSSIKPFLSARSKRIHRAS